MKDQRRGFTLIELLVVIAIIAILVALLLPAVQQVREAARKSQCQDHLHNLVIALHDYEINHRCYPPGGFSEGVSGTAAGNGLSFHVMILPFAEQKPLYDQFNFRGSNWTMYDDVISPLATEPIGLFLCPSGKETLSASETSGGSRIATTHYLGVMGPKTDHTGTPLTPKINGGNYPAASTTGGSGHEGFATTGILRKQFISLVRDIVDGTSNTLMLGELSWNKCNCYRGWPRGGGGSATAGMKNIENPINLTPYNGSNNFNDVSFGSQHPGGAQFGLGDGKVTFLSENIDMGIYRALGSRDEGEPAAVP
ncbi:MAG: DUF1559 domain-containing protein [Planctomycetaceae bacterium]